MKIVCISDTHCKLNKIKIPDGDLLIHSGDLTFQGNIQEVSKEARDLEKIASKFTHGVVFVPGNHDWGFERNEQLFRSLMGDVKVLIHESIEIDGIKIFGSPYTPEFCNWAYNVDRALLKPYWDQIPDDTQILVSHGPPMGILDQVARWNAIENVGCNDLKNRIKDLKGLRFHIFGHIHENYGTKQIGEITFINASSCDGQYRPVNSPIIITTV